jgi:hypothetical protein
MPIEKKFRRECKYLAINHDFSGLQQCRHSPDHEGLYAVLHATGEMTALCYSCHDDRAQIVARRRHSLYRYQRGRPRTPSEGGDGPCGWFIRRAASRLRDGRGELRHSGARSSRYRTGAGPQTRAWTGSGGTCRGVRFPLARTGNVRSAARAQARLRPNLRARLQLTSSWPSRSRDSRLLPMVGGRPCQRIKIFVVSVYIKARFLASGLHVFRVVKSRSGMAV